MPFIDGNPIDIATLCVAFFYAAFRGLRNSSRWSVEKFIADLSYGLSLFPLLMLSGVAFSSWIAAQLMDSNKIIMSMAGVIALTVTLRRSFEKQGRYLI